MNDSTIKEACNIVVSGVIARQADIVAALTLDVLKGASSAFDTGKFINLKVFIIFIINYDMSNCI